MYRTYTCSRCGQPVSKDVVSCPHCGVWFSGVRNATPITNPKKSTSSRYITLGCLVAIGVVAISVIFTFFGRGNRSASTVLLATKTASPLPPNTATVRVFRSTATQVVEGNVTAVVVTNPTQEHLQQATATQLQTSISGNLYERAQAGEFRGSRVNILVPGDSSQPDSLLVHMIDVFEDNTGIRVEPEIVTDLSPVLEIKLQAGDPPDIAAISSMEQVAKLASQGALIDPRGILGEATLHQRYDPAWLDLAMFPTPQGKGMAGIWHHYIPASIVFYARDDFEAAGYGVPETWDELIELSDRIVADGGTPWCIGIDLVSAYRWIPAVWLEEIILHSQPIDVYHDFIAGELAFDSTQFDQSVDRLSAIWFSDGYVYRESRDPGPIQWTDIPKPLFTDPPGCWLYLADSYNTDIFPANADFGENFDWFLVPPIEEECGRPQVVWGTLMAVFADRPEVGAFLDYLARPESVQSWVETGSELSPHHATPLEWYSDPFMRSLAQGMSQASPLVLDALSLMPRDAREQLYNHLSAVVENGVASLAGPPPKERHGHIADLLSDGSISVETRGSGIDGLDLDIENLIDELLDVEIPAGTYFVSGSAGVQNMVVRHTEVVQIKPGEQLKLLLDAACANMGLDVPTDQQGFSVKRQGSSNLAKLMPVLESANASYIVSQAAIWIITDNANYSDLGKLVSGVAQRRAIKEEDAAKAMRLVDQAGIDITQRRIWKDREIIAASASPELAAWLNQRSP